MDKKQKPKQVDQARITRMFERLRESIHEYEFYEHLTPVHSSYDNWHFFGRRRPRRDRVTRLDRDRESTTTSTSSSPRPTSSRTISDYGDSTGDATATEEKDLLVVARVSKHTLRLEREFKHAQFIQQRGSKEDGEHFVQPVHFAHLPARKPGDKPLAASIVVAPGRNYLVDIIEFGPNFYAAKSLPTASDAKDMQLPLLTFLHFAVGASECCEILHFSHEMVHGELRGDAFHYNKDTGVVRLVNFGSGSRSFEHGLTSAGWSNLTSERGVEHKLQFIAPEQTGRLPAEPDSRTDIYSLGILFWNMLAGRPVFEGKNPLEVMQNVLSRRIPPLSGIRSDVPDALSAIIQKMTQKAIDDRYNSASGVKHDLVELKRILTEGDTKALDAFKVASNDASCFFKLPSHQVGRHEKRKLVIDVLQRVARRAARAGPITKRNLYNLSSGSSILSSDRPDLSTLDDVVSESTSSGDRDRDSRLNSVAEILPYDMRDHPSRASIDSSERSVIGDAVNNKPSVEVQSNLEGKTSFNSSDSLARKTSNTMFTGSESTSIFRNAQKLKHRGRTEVIAICGQAGFGKSTLVQSVQSCARRHGYFTSAKFDSVQQVPFEPMTKVMSSLFRQIFSEPHVDTPFHDNIRTLVGPVWPVLHAYLELPEWLLTSGATGKSAEHTVVSTHDTSATKTSTPVRPGKKQCNAAATQEWLRSGGSSKNTRFMHTFIDVLRLLAMQRFICFCLDDLQFADAESLELMHLIVATRVPLVLMLTYRQEELLTPATRKILERATLVELGPFNEQETGDYVSETLLRPREYCLPLVAVLQEKTQGNPFFIREMLDLCYRKKCIYYCWRCAQWEFSIDRVFDEFSSPDSGRFSSNDFIARRLVGLPSEAKSLLAWAAMLGNVFPYKLIQYVMSCECSRAVPEALVPPRSDDPVHGLQVAMNEFIIMSTTSDDEFKFAHDRFVAASDALCNDYNREEMHFVVASAMMKHTPYDPSTQSSKVIFDQARHVCAASEVVKRRATNRAPFRELLYQAAETAKETGARNMCLFYYKHCLELLSDDPWSEDDDKDTFKYNETLTLFTQAADTHCYHGQLEDAAELVGQIFDHARTPMDKAAAAIIQNRIYVQRGDNQSAFLSLLDALSDLGIELPTWTWEQCDEDFHRLVAIVQTNHPEIDVASRDWTIGNELNTIGALMIELLSASFWTDARLFYQSTLVLMDIYLKRGVFPQVALGMVHFATICIYRFNLIQCGLGFAGSALSICNAFDQEYYTIGRCLTLHSFFLGHLQTDMRTQFGQLNRGLEATITAGDRILQLLNLGINGLFRIWVSEDMSETENYIASIAEEFPDWQSSVRGGSLLTTVRQYTRALQGRTQYKSAATIFDDEEHTTESYFAFLNDQGRVSLRSMSLYQAQQIDALFRFGYYREALTLGDEVALAMDEIWCSRVTYSTFFFRALSMIAIVRDESEDVERDELLQRVKDLRTRIELIASTNPVNYSAWLLLIDAELADADKKYDKSLTAYENAIDHSILHGYTLDEALGMELYADFLVRRGAKRPARGVVLDCISAYRRISALGKAKHMSEKYEFILYGTRSASNFDASTQTDIVDTGNTPYKLEENNNLHGPQTPADRMQEWLDPPAPSALSLKRESSVQLPAGLAAVGLDMIDLASILESSQLLSSELDVERLLSKLTKIIVESTGAATCGICVESDTGGWIVAATGAPEGMTPPRSGMQVQQLEDTVAMQVTTYVLRFKEEVFLKNVLEDERFANVPSSWLEANPDGASMITMPILHGEDALLGSVYCQAPPNSFTERTVTLLKLLVNQIAISIANALLFKRVEKVSASNQSMVVVQKQAVAQAREAEKKAKEAEAKAMEMVRLKDEAAKAKSMFLANVSHELRTPLNGVIGMSEMMKATHLTKEQEEHADSIRVCADTLLSIINDILDFSKLEAGKMAIISVPLSLTQTISEVMRALSYANIERDLKTIEQLRLPSDLVVMGDPVRIHQVLFNICSNAYKFTPNGSVTVRAVSEHEDDDMIQVTISVRDTGIGITEEQQKKLFLPFSQADSSTARSYGGTGLGLSICKAIVENVMNGRIWLESEQGVGTTVSFSLPFKKVKPSADGTPQDTTLSRRQLDPMSGFTPPTEEDGTNGRAVISLAGIPRNEIKVCIAEDNPINQKIAINFVKKIGFNCEAFGDGQQAVDALGRASNDGKPFHLVLMDVQMPVLDGYDATRAIRNHSDPTVRDILVIAMTASAIRGDREKCLEAGMNSYLAKPVRADTLKQMLESYLDQPAKSMPDLQSEANQLVNKVVSQETENVNGMSEKAPSKANETGGGRQENLNPKTTTNDGVRAQTIPERPKSSRHPATEIHLQPDEMVKKSK